MIRHAVEADATVWIRLAFRNCAPRTIRILRDVRLAARAAHVTATEGMTTYYCIVVDATIQGYWARS
jgi:hypothetical protein